MSQAQATLNLLMCPCHTYIVVCFKVGHLLPLSVVAQKHNQWHFTCIILKLCTLVKLFILQLSDFSCFVILVLFCFHNFVCVFLEFYLFILFYFKILVQVWKWRFLNVHEGCLVIEKDNSDGEGMIFTWWKPLTSKTCLHHVCMNGTFNPSSAH
jgi:hypothetical protein